MKVKIEVILEMESGEYELTMHNLTNPGQSVEYDRIMKLMERVFDTWRPENKVDSEK